MKTIFLLAITYCILPLSAFAQKAYMLAVGLQHVDYKKYKDGDKSYSSKATAGVPKDLQAMSDIALRYKYSYTQLLNEEATKEAIIYQINAIGKMIKPDDWFVFYYSGHGDTIKDISGDERTGFDEVYVAYNGFLLDDKIDECLKKYFTKTKNIMIIDACHSGTSYKMAAGLIMYPFIFHDFTVAKVKNNKAYDNENKMNEQQNAITYCDYHHTPLLEPYSLIYFGATSDYGSAIGAGYGGLLTYQLTNILKGEPYRYTYRELACRLQDRLKSHQNFQYHEIGSNVSLYSKNITFKTN